jgi:hypothetical protein
MACSFLKEGKKNKRIKQIIAQPRVLVKELTYSLIYLPLILKSYP